MRSMFGISLSHDAEKLRPFRANVMRPFCMIGLHPILEYYTPSGLTIYMPPVLSIYTPLVLTQPSPERALFTNDGCSPSKSKQTTIPSPERALYPNDGCSPSKIKRIMIPSTLDAEKLRPFRANVSRPFCMIGLHPILMYYTPLGLTIYMPPVLTSYTPLVLTLHSPERALYPNDGCSPSKSKQTTIPSPERALSISDGCSPSKIKRITIPSKLDAEKLRPFRANVTRPFCMIGLHPILEYYTPSGLTTYTNP